MDATCKIIFEQKIIEIGRKIDADFIMNLILGLDCLLMEQNCPSAVECRLFLKRHYENALSPLTVD